VIEINIGVLQSLQNIVVCESMDINTSLLIKPKWFNLRWKNMVGNLAKMGLIASMFSIAGSLYIYFVQGDEMQGIFVGLWAPTLINATRGMEAWLEEYRRV